MSVPAVSVVMPMYNAGRFVRAALDSVLAQTMGDFECIVVNDGSTDGCRELVAAAAAKDPRVRLVDNDRNLGLVPTLNRGLGLARAPFVARQDADDVSAPGRLAAQLERMRARPELVALGTCMEVVDEQGRSTGVFDVHGPDVLVRWSMFFHHPFAHPTMLLRTDALRQVGGYSEAFPLAEDFDLWERLSAVGRLGNLPQRLVRYLRHSQAVSERQRGRQLDYELRVRRRIMSRELGRDVPAEVVRWTAAPAFGTDSRGAARDAEGRELRAAFALVRELWASFCAREALEPEQAALVRRDTAAKLVNVCAAAAARSTVAGAGLYLRAVAFHPALLAPRSLGRALRAGARALGGRRA